MYYIIRELCFFISPYDKSHFLQRYANYSDKTNKTAEFISVRITFLIYIKIKTCKVPQNAQKQVK